MVRCATPAMRYACSQAKSALSAYTPTSRSSVRAEGVEVDAVAGVQGHAGDHVGDAALALGAQAGDGLRLGHAGRDLLADDALEDDVGGVAEDLGADDGEGHADHREQHDQ